MAAAASRQAELHATRQYYDSGAGEPYHNSSQGTATTSTSTSNSNNGTTHSYDPYAQPAIGGRSSRRPDCARKLVVVGDGGGLAIERLVVVVVELLISQTRRLREDLSADCLFREPLSRGVCIGHLQ